mgnify:CR=1 FL=1
MKLILASQSPRRQELLKFFQIPFTVQVCDIDETMDASKPAYDEVARISRKKAEAANRSPEDLVIAADTIVVCNGEILGKPKDTQDAFRMLKLLSGRDHQVMTGMTVLKGETVITCTEVTDIIVLPMLEKIPDEEILPDDEITKNFRCGIFNPHKTSVSRHYKGKGNIELYDKTVGIKVVYETDEKYKYRMFYKDVNDKFICLEPMNCMVNCPNSPFGRELANFDYIEPNSSKTYISKIYVEKYGFFCSID